MTTRRQRIGEIVQGGVRAWRKWRKERGESLTGIVAGDYVIRDGIDWTFVTSWAAKDAPASLMEGAYHQVEFDQPFAGANTEKLGFPAYDLLHEWDYMTRLDFITRTHQVWERNPLAKAAVNLTRQFAVSTGMSVTTKSLEVKQVIGQFVTDTNANVIDKGMCDALQLDGEVFVRWTKAVTGKSTIRFVKPWDVRDIETKEGDDQTVTGYLLADGTTASADDIVHVKINALPYEKRGRPELIPVLPWLKAYKDWLEDRFRQNRRRSAIFDVTLKGAKASEVAAKRNALRQPPPPGSIIVHNDNETWQSVVQNINASDVAADGDAFRIMVAVGVQLPEYMLSKGDSQLATATAQSLPALMKFRDFQDVMREMWLAVLRKVVRAAVDAGLIPEESQVVDSDGQPVMDVDGKPRMVKAMDAFDVQYPALSDADPLNVAQALQIDVANGWCANSTASAKRGYDPAVEKRKIAEEQKEVEEQAAARAEAEAERNPPEDEMGNDEEEQPEDEGVPPAASAPPAVGKGKAEKKGAA